MIQIKNVTKRFGEVIAVDNLSLHIDNGIYGLVGQNGAGKSTLFRLIAGVYKKDSGDILIDTFDAETKQAKELVFFLPDDPYVERNGNMRNMLNFYANFYDVDVEKFDKLIDKFELPRNTSLRGFSKGMKRQAFISLALSIKCKYLLLDEAFDGLDPIVLDIIKDELLEAKDEGKVIVVSSHNINTLEKLVDTFIMVTQGRLSNVNSNENIGENFVKYQALYKNDVTEEMFTAKGLTVVSFKKYGSIHNIVVMDCEGLDEKMNEIGNPILLERVPIDIDEIVKLNMLIARKEQR